MKVHIIILALIVTMTSAIPISNNDRHKELVKRGLFDNISHFPFLASSSSAHSSSGSSSSSSSSSSDEFDFHDYHHDTIPDFHSESHSHLIHHPELDGHQHDFHSSYDHDVPISYQHQYFGHVVPTSYHDEHSGFDNHLSHDDHYSDFNKFEHDSLLQFSHLDAPEYSHGHIGDYKNYGGDLADYSHHAGLLDISDDHKIDHLLDPYSPSHSSYDSY